MKENRSLQIGTVKVDGILALGPMAGVTDLPFRCLCKEQGAGLIYTEMVSAKGILYNNKNSKKPKIAKLFPKKRSKVYVHG